MRFKNICDICRFSTQRWKGKTTQYWREMITLPFYKFPWKKVKSQMVRSVPGLDKCDGGGKWLPLDTSHQLLRQCRGQDKQNGTRAPRHWGRGWIVEFLIRGGAGETERRVAPMGRGAPCAPQGSNWTHRPSERIVGGGGGENQLLSDCEHVSIVSILFEYCEYCEIVKAGGWV